MYDVILEMAGYLELTTNHSLILKLNRLQNSLYNHL